MYRVLFQKFEFQNKGTLQLKHKGPTNTYFVIGRKTVYSPSQVLLPNLSTLEWRHAGVQLRNSSKRNSFHDALNRRSRPISFHHSKENVSQAASPASGNKNRYSTDSPKLHLQTIHSVNTPPGSLTRVHRNSGGIGGDSGHGSRDNVNKVTETKMPYLMSAPDKMFARVESPELPLVHYRNVNMKGSGTIGHQQEQANTRTLTQSQILHAQCESRCQSRGSISSRNENGISPNKDSTDLATTDGIASSSRYSVTSSPSSIHTSPGSSSTSDPTAPPQFSIPPPDTRRIQPPPPPRMNGYQENSLHLSKVPESIPMQKTRINSTRNHYVQNNLNKDISSDELQPNGNSLTNSDIAELNNIMKELGHPDQIMETNHKESGDYRYSPAKPEYFELVTAAYVKEPPSYYQPIIQPLPSQYRRKHGSNHSSPAAAVRPKSLASPASSYHGSPQTYSSSPHLKSNSLRGMRNAPVMGSSHHRYRQNSQSSSISSEPQSPIISSSSCPCSPPSPMYSPRDIRTASLDYRNDLAQLPIGEELTEPLLPPEYSPRVVYHHKPLPAHLQPGSQFEQYSPHVTRAPIQMIQKQHSLPDTREYFGASMEPLLENKPEFGTLPSSLCKKVNTPSPSWEKHNKHDKGSKDRKKDVSKKEKESSKHRDKDPVKNKVKDSSQSKERDITKNKDPSKNREKDSSRHREKDSPKIKDRNSIKKESSKRKISGANHRDNNKEVSTAERQRRVGGLEFSPPPLPPPPPDDLLSQQNPVNPHGIHNSEMVGPLSAISVPTQQALVFVNPSANVSKPVTVAPYSPVVRPSHNSAFQPIANANEEVNTEGEPEQFGGARPKDSAVHVDTLPKPKPHKKRPSPERSPAQTQTDTMDSQSSDKQSTSGDSPSVQSPNKRPAAPPFQVKRRQKFTAPPRLCRSLDYIPSDIEDTVSMTSRPDSPEGEDSPSNIPSLLGPEAFMPITALVRQLADNISLSSMGSSEMSRSDPALNYDSAASAYESEYDNYRPGMASDEDYFIPEPISDIDLDLFDDINIDNVTISDTYSLDMPLSLMASHMTSHLHQSHLQRQRQLQQQQQQQQQRQQQQRQQQMQQQQAPLTDTPTKKITDV